MKNQKNLSGTDAEQAFHTPQADPNGSYTGVPEDPEEIPIQDADDL